MTSSTLAPRLRQELIVALQRERERLRMSIRTLAAAERALGESQAMEGAAGGDAGGAASDLAEQELDLVLKDTECRRLAEIEAALRRVADGTYGACEGCGGPIATQRLFAIPWTRYCIGCATRDVTVRYPDVDSRA